MDSVFRRTFIDVRARLGRLFRKPALAGGALTNIKQKVVKFYIKRGFSDKDFLGRGAVF